MAAAVVTLISASKNHVRYTITGGVGETVNLDATGAATPDLATDSPAGPLHDILAAAYANQAAARAAMRTTNLRISVQDQVGRGEVLVNWDGVGNLRLTPTTRVAVSQLVLTIEYRNSIER